MFDGIIASSLVGRGVRLHDLGRYEEAFSALERGLARSYRCGDVLTAAVVPSAAELMADIAITLSRPASARTVLERALREVESHAGEPGWGVAMLGGWMCRVRERLARLESEPQPAAPEPC